MLNTTFDCIASPKIITTSPVVISTNPEYVMWSHSSRGVTLAACSVDHVFLREFFNGFSVITPDFFLTPPGLWFSDLKLDRESRKRPLREDLVFFISFRLSSFPPSDLTLLENRISRRPDGPNLTSLSPGRVKRDGFTTNL